MVRALDTIAGTCTVVADTDELEEEDVEEDDDDDDEEDDDEASSLARFWLRTHAARARSSSSFSLDSVLLERALLMVTGVLSLEALTGA